MRTRPGFSDPPTRPLALAAAVVAGLLGSAVAAAADPDGEAARHFEARIRPLFLERCARCHGPEKPKAGLRLDGPAGLAKGGTSGPVVRPGDPEHSLLIQAVR